MAQDRKLILLTNDDGIEATGILALRSHILKFADCTVVAPHEECSASSHAVTLRGSLTVKKHFHEGEFIGYKVWGKPSDCVKLALCELLDKRPDMVVSGINSGPNLGVATFYSGTVAGAREAAIISIPSFAFSVTSHEVKDFEGAAEIATQLIKELLENPTSPKVYFNVNIPNLPKPEIKGCKIVKQADSYYEEEFTRGSFSNDEKAEFFLGGELLVTEGDGENDVSATEAGFVAVTPLTLNLTDAVALEKLQQSNLFSDPT